MSKEQEYKEIFLSEAHESHAELNNLFTDLEKDTSNKRVIDSIFRITHTLKGNAMGMGFTAIAELGHVMEDVFNEVKNGSLVLDDSLFTSLFKANDILGELIDAIKNPRDVKYKGIKTKLEVILKNNKSSAGDNKAIKVEEASIIPNAEDEKTHILDDLEKIERAHILEELEENDDLSASKITLSDVVQVPVRKLDSLLNIVGELIIEKDSLLAKSAQLGFKVSELARLHRITSDLQYGVMDVRLAPIGFLFNKFNRIVRDVAVIENKKVELALEGTEIEIDRNILRIMSDSLVHLVRNAVSHGIETPEKRKAKGKPETGKIKLSARNEKDTVFIEVSDDGNGIDLNAIKKKAVEKGIISREYAQHISNDEVLMCIFEPGFSNAETITEVSGRGVGMDVVKRSTESIGGKITIDTQLGIGSTFTLALPSSMAVKGALLFELNNQEFAIALTYTEAVISIKKKDIHKVNNGLVSTYLGNTISIVFLKDIFDHGSLKNKTKENAFHITFDTISNEQKLDVVIVSYSNKYVGFIVDRLLQQKEIVEKTLSNPIDNGELISGATILGNGNVCLVLDVVSIISTMFKERITQKITN